MDSAAPDPVAGTLPDGAAPKPPAIRSDINSLDLLAAARYYRDELGWTVHALYGPSRGPDRERGKRPWHKNWKLRTPDDATDAYLLKHFGNGQQNNLGKVNQLPEITIDLDSKQDQGASAVKWDADTQEFQQVPCERTAGGLHLHVFCHDVPPEALAVAGKEQKLKGKLNEAVDYELFFGGNIVLAPSTHKSGHRYTWIRTGPIPEVKWETIQKVFNITLSPAREEARGRRKRRAWWTRFKGDLSTLDMVALAKQLLIYGKSINAGEGKHSIRCPWSDSHTNEQDVWRPEDTSTVFFEARKGKFPGFKCLHVAHGEKGLADFLIWADNKMPGIIDRNCARQRVWEKGQTAADGRPRLVLPYLGRSDSEFATEAGEIIGGDRVAKGLYLRHDMAVEVNTVGLSGNRTCLGFAPIKPARAITLIEKFAELGKLLQDSAEQQEFVTCSMGKNTAEILLNAPQFKGFLPAVERILDVPVPIITAEGAMAYPQPGYDPRFKTYLNPGAPRLEAMSLADALGLLRELFCEFYFKDEQSLIHALAAFLTPFCRGLFPRWNARTPVWLYKANRERAGKDYCANLSPLLYEGRTNEDAPLNSDDVETRKKITSSLIAGRRRIHWANCRGHINNAAFEAIATAEMWTDRVLGENREVMVPNEMEISLSANTGLTYTPDFANRCRTILFHYEEEDANARRFSKTDLHGWLLANRGRFVSALAALVDHWDRAGRPSGPTPFTSFPIWARIVGGIMTCAGLGDPCLPQHDAFQVDGDQQTGDMKTLFALANEQFGEEWVKKDRIFELLAADGEALFSWMDMEKRSGKIAFSLLLNKFVGRILGSIRLQRNATAKKTQQHTYQFVIVQGGPPHDRRLTVLDGVFGEGALPGSAPADGHVGHVGHVFPTPCRNDEIGNSDGSGKNNNEENNLSGFNMPNMPKVPMQNYTPVASRDALGDIAEQIAISGQSAALDLETYGAKGGLNPWAGDIRLLSLAVPGAGPWVLDLKAIGYDLGPLADVLTSGTVLGHNVKFDALWLRVKCGLRLGALQDTLTASRLLAAGTGDANDLGAVLKRHMNVDLPKDQGRSDWGGMVLTDEQLRYAADDVRYLHALHDKLQGELDQASLAAVYTTELQLLPVVVDMEAHGFAIDRARLEDLSRKAVADRDATDGRLRELFNDPKLNPASPVQMKAALAKEGITVESTAEEALQAQADDRYIPAIQAHRAATKRAEQADKLIEMLCPDGRIHGRFDPTGTATGRFSSREPNLQNIGRGDIRSCFVAAPGCRLVVADYSQIELRVAAAIAGEGKMIEAYRQGQDLHRQTAALVLDKPLEAVTKDDRQLAKAVNFGLLYGQSPRGLVRYAKTSYGVTLTEEQARVIHSKFFSSYSKLQAWHQLCNSKAPLAKEVRTVSGRRRLLPTGHNETWKRFAAMLNTPVQGGAAEGLKAAMIRIAGALPAGAALVSTVHDEIIVETPADQADHVKVLVESLMVDAMAGLFPDVPIEASVTVCDSWDEK